MKVTVHVNHYLKKYFNKTGEIEIELEVGSTVGDLIFAIYEQYGVELLKNIKDEVQLRRYCIVVIDKRFSFLSDTISGRENEIKLIPPISGG